VPPRVLRSLSSELAALAERRAERPRVYADANLPAGIVEFMRERLKWDVFFVMEHDELRRATDDEHFRRARDMRRTLVSLDHDYLDDRRFPPPQTAGILILNAPNERLLARLLSRLDQQLFRARSGPDAGAAAAVLPLDRRKLDAHLDWPGQSGRARG
jgi:predicted nuclease of predicted toxin-antitoxin system